jgi:hypothetical protein
MIQLKPSEMLLYKCSWKSKKVDHHIHFTVFGFPKNIKINDEFKTFFGETFNDCELQAEEFLRQHLVG